MPNSKLATVEAMAITNQAVDQAFSDLKDTCFGVRNDYFGLLYVQHDHDDVEEYQYHHGVFGRPGQKIRDFLRTLVDDQNPTESDSVTGDENDATHGSRGLTPSLEDCLDCQFAIAKKSNE